MKKTMSILLAITLVIVLCSSATAVEQDSISNLSDEECVAFLENNGIEIPETYSEDMSWLPFVQFVIKQVEDDPDVEFAFGYSVALNFAYEIKAAVNAYNGVCDNNTYAVQRSNSILQDNVVYGNWKAEYTTYNCYAYAIGYAEKINPGVIKWIDNGNLEADYDYNWHANVGTVAEWIEYDLESLGYTVTSRTITNPNTTVSSHTNLICVRIDLDGELYYGFRDFHLMKKGLDGNWYHKPGGTNPLRYKYTPTNGNAWVSEGYKGATGEYFRDELFTYDSDIWFIEYTTPHEWEYVYCGTPNGTHQHINTCTICWQTSGTAIACTYRTGSDVCKICGHNKNAAITSLGIPEDTYTYVNE